MVVQIENEGANDGVPSGPGDDEVGPVTHADLLDLGEEVVAGVSGEDVGKARLDAHPDECQLFRAPPIPQAAANCSSPSFIPVSWYGRVGCGDDSDIAMSM